MVHFLLKKLTFPNVCYWTVLFSVRTDGEYVEITLFSVSKPNPTIPRTDNNPRCN